MKKTLTLIIASIISFAAIAQNTIVKGRVVDTLTGEGEPYATIQFIIRDAYQEAASELGIAPSGAEADDKVVAYTITDEDGSFEHSIPGNGSYIFFYSNLGKKDLQIPFTLAGEEVYDFGTIEVEDDAEALKAASITAQKNLVKLEVDRISYKVEDDVDAPASTVLDMLRKVPMVSVDGQDNITVNGSSSFQVYVDGKPNQMLSTNASTIFKVMPASSVKSIEVVTNPGVRYDAEGAAGVLNITTNAAVTGGQSIADGQYGTITAKASNRGPGGSAFYSMQEGKLSLSVNASVNDMKSPGAEMESERIQSTEAGDIITKTLSQTDNSMPIRMISTSANYELDSQNLFSASFSYMKFGMESSGISSTSITSPYSPELSYTGTTLVTSGSSTINASADYQHTWADAPGRSLVLSYQLSSAPSINNTLNTFTGSALGLDLTDRKADGSSNSLSHSFQADFTTPIAAGQTFSTGVKYLYRNNSSDQTNYLWNGSDFVNSGAGDMNYDYYNRIGAAYLEYSGNFGSLGVKGGLRYEQTWQDVTYAKGQGTDFSLQYGNLVPAASLQWNLSNTQNIGLSYNMRISRPGITYLNPYIDTTDPTSLSYGNTELNTENSHNISLVYNIFTPKFVANVNLRETLVKDGISQYSFYDSNNILNTTYGNIVNTTSTGLNGYMMYMPTNKTRIIFSGGLDYSDISSTQLGQSNSGWSHNIMLGLQQTLPLDLRLSANVINAGSTVTLQGTSTGISMVTAGLSRTFLDGKLNASVNCMTTFNGMDLKMETTTEGAGFVNRSSTTMPMGQISASISYTFGKQSNYGSKKVNRRDSDDNQLNSSSMSQTVGTMVM